MNGCGLTVELLDGKRLVPDIALLLVVGIVHINLDIGGSSGVDWSGRGVCGRRRVVIIARDWKHIFRYTIRVHYGSDSHSVTKRDKGRFLGS